MKKVTIAIMFFIIGSMITFLIIFAATSERKDTIKVDPVVSTPRQGVYTIDAKGNTVLLSFTEAAKKIMPAVVNVQSSQPIQSPGRDEFYQIPEPFRDFFRYYFGPESREGRPQVRVGIGSGVIVNEDGYIVTNNHVVSNAGNIEVTLYDNRVFKAEIKGSDPQTDLALLHIDGKDLPVIPFMNSDSVEVGEWVLAVGNPYELSSTVTAGIISAKGRNLNISQNSIEAYLQTDAAINPGNSGGALATLNGALVGINTAIASPTGSFSGYGFAIPSNIVSKVVADLKKYGSVQRAVLGVAIRNLNGELAKEKGLNITEGAYIDSVVPGSAAEKAGIRPGDVVVFIGQQKIKGASNLQERIAELRPGDKLELTINRKGATKNITVILQSTRENKAVSKKKT